MSCVLGNKISSGSFGDVYKVKYNTEDKKNDNYALKIIKNCSYGIKCLSELIILLFFKYSYIMDCFQFHIDIEEHVTKILMPLASYDLKTKFSKPLKSKDKNKMSKYKELIWQLVCAVAFLHSQGIVHGDIKPSNILLYKNTVKLSDFSLSSFHLSEDHRIYVRESFAENYRSPEIWKNEGYSFKADIWALGCTIYELIYDKKYQIDIKSKKFEEDDNDLKDLLTGALKIDEEKRSTIWQILDHPFFKTFDKKIVDFSTKCYNHKFSSETEFIEKLKNLIEPYEMSIPEYVYKIISMKLFRRAIDKEYYIYLNNIYIRYEVKIIELLWNDKLGFQLFI